MWIKLSAHGYFVHWNVTNYPLCQNISYYCMVIVGGSGLKGTNDKNLDLQVQIKSKPSGTISSLIHRPTFVLYELYLYILQLF